MNEEPLPTSRRVRPLDLVALATTVCLVLTVVFIQWKILPTYAAMLAVGGLSMPIPVSLPGQLLSRMPVYGLLFLLGWALYRRVRHRVEPPVTLARVLATVNIFAVVVLMGQTSGFVAFAVHGPKIVQHVVAAQEQSPAKRTTPPIPGR
jgi:hypothetical protein